jgi:hypothetical protein
LNSGENDRRSRRPCFRFFCCFMDHSRAFSRYPGCPPAGVKLNLLQATKLAEALGVPTEM